MLGIGLLLLATSECRASPITYEFGGTITSADPSTGVGVGTRFTGSVTYDPGENWSFSGPIWEGHVAYSFGQSSWVPGSVPDHSALNIEVDGRTVLSSSGGIDLAVSGPMYPDQPKSYDSTSVSLTTPNFNNPSADLIGGITLTNPSRWVLPSFLPPLTLDFADFGTGSINITARHGSPYLVLYEGQIDTFEVVPTPEPTCLALLGLGVAGWLVRSRRRRARPAA